MSHKWDFPAFMGCMAVMFIGMAVSAFAPAVPQPIPARPYVDRLESWRVYDGDTLTDCEIDLGYGLVLRDSIRVVGIDAPEVTGEQSAAGKVVRDAAADWISQHGELWLIGHGRDKYGRILGDVQPPGVGQTLGEWLVERGYAHAYDGTGPRPEWTEAELKRIVENEQ